MSMTCTAGGNGADISAAPMRFVLGTGVGRFGIGDFRVKARIRIVFQTIRREGGRARKRRSLCGQRCSMERLRPRPNYPSRSNP